MIQLMLTLAGALVAAAAPPPPASNPVPADQVAAARAEGDALLRAAHAEALFDNETGLGSAPSTAILLRHRASGFRCLFVAGKPENRVSVFRTLTIGTDVGCTTRGLTSIQETYIFRAPEKNLAQLLADAEHEVKSNDATAQVVTPMAADPLALPAFMKVPDHVSASLSSAKVGYRIVLGKFGDWAVETRFTGGPLVAASSALDPIWLATVAEGQGHGPSVSAKTATVAATPEAIHAEGDDLVARSRAPDLFENVSKDKLISVRHRPSGFVCTFAPDESENTIQVFTGLRPRGEDIGCTTRIADMVVSYFVTKFPMAVTPQQAAQVYLLEIKRTHPDVASAKGPFVNANVQPKPGVAPPVERVTAHLTYVDHGETVYSRLCVAVVNGWVIEQRINATLDHQQVADLLGEVSMLNVTNQMVGGGAT